jgi:hypothetical protein
MSTSSAYTPVRHFCDGFVLSIGITVLGEGEGCEGEGEGEGL